jgi:hypothetical protein
MKPSEVCEKLKPIIGNKADMLSKQYLLADYKEKHDVEESINILRIKYLNEHEILLPPPNDSSGDYPLADVYYNSQKKQTFYLRKKDMPRHIAIFGTTGSGKTNACFTLIANLVYDDIPFLITDFKKNYRDLINSKAGKGIKVYTVGKPLSPFYFNPLIPPKGTNPQIYINKLIDVINHSHFVSYGVDNLLQKAIHEVYTECGLYDELKKIPTFHDVLAALNNMKLSGRESLWKASAQRTLQDLTFGPIGDVFNSHTSFNIKDLLDQQIVLELDALPQTTKTFLIEALLLQIYLYRVNEGVRDEQLKHMMILEEAHHLLLKKQEQGETITDIFLREIRETGQGVCLLDQSPSMISNTALSNTNTLIAMQLKHRDDINQISKALLLDDVKYFGMLKVGEAIIKTQAPHPFLIKFPHVAIKKGTVTDVMIKSHMATETNASLSDHSAPNSPLTADSRPNRVSSDSDKLTTDETEFMKDISAHPLSGVSSRYKRLGYSVDKGNEIKIALVDKTFLTPISLPTKNGRILLLEPTQRAKEYFLSLGMKSDSNRKGGLVHQYWSMKVANYYRHEGFKVRYEVSISQGKTVDLVIEKDNQKIAVEIETGKSNAIENIRKCSSFQSIICVATNPQAEKDIKQDLAKDKMESERIKVISCKRYC